MKYKPELGFFGNLERAYTELTKTNNKVLTTENNVQQMNDRVASTEEVNNITFVALAETNVLDDDTAARHTEVFPVWEVGVFYKTGQMRVDPDTGKLYRLTGNSHTSIETWKPSVVPAVWTVVDVTHTGTVEDPIPAARSMEYVYGKYYLDEEDGNLYLCKREGEVEGGTITLHFMPHELVGQYFEVVTE